MLVLAVCSRSVEDDIKAFSLGVSVILARLLGQIPGPIFLGRLIDSTCKLWSKPDCESSGVCQLYKLDMFAHTLMIYWMTLSLIAVILFLIASLFARRASFKSGQELSYTVNGQGENQTKDTGYGVAAF